MTEQDKQALADIGRAFDRAVEICGKDMVVRFLTGKGEGWIVENPPAQPAQAGAEPVAFVHWPLSGPPRLVWYSNKALDAAILKTYEGHQPDMLLYTRLPARVPLTDEQILKEILPMRVAEYTTLCGPTEILKFARAIEAAHGIGGGK